MSDKNIVNVITIAASICAAAYTYYVSKKVSKVCDCLDTSINNISKDVKVEVSDSIIEEAVKKAADREVAKSVKAVVSDVMDESEDIITREAKKVVDDIRSDLSVTIRGKIEEFIDELDRDEVKQNAVDTLVKKLEKSVSEKAKFEIVAKNDAMLNRYGTYLADGVKTLNMWKNAFNGSNNGPF